MIVLYPLKRSLAFETADFSRMRNPCVGLSDVIRKAFVEPDERETKAATTVDLLKSMGLPECDKTVKLGRPFLYAIADFQSGASSSSAWWRSCENFIPS